MPPLLSLRDARAAFGAQPLFSGLDVHLSRGDRVALVGRNGSGKSTLLRMIAGELPLDEGSRVVQAEARVAYLPQEPDFSAFRTVGEAALAALPSELAHEPWRAEAALDALQLPMDRAVQTLSGGELRRLALARMVVMDADLLLLDEPTNHLDLPSIEWLERSLESSRAGLVIVSHDRAFLTRLTRSILWLDQGQLHRTERGFGAFEAWSEEVMHEQALAQARLEKRIVEETRWSREGISARRKRNMGRMRRLQEMRAERAALRTRGRYGELSAQAGEVSGKRVIELVGVSHSFGDRPIVRDLDLSVLRGDRLGLVGPNGAGKSTLVRLMLGQLEPDEGAVQHGTRLSPVVIDQRRSRLDEAHTVQAVLCEPGTDQVMVHGQLRHVSGYLRDFLFEGRDARRPIKSLSGGERARLLLAMELKRSANVLVLDEPTNDLDLETLDLLQEILQQYEGTLIVVSHDRDFLDRLVTSTLAFEGDGRWVEYAGGYSDLLSQRALSEAAQAPQPPAPSKAAAPAKAKSERAQLKLSYREQRHHEALPAQIDALETEIAALQVALEDGSFYQRDPEGFAQALARLEQAKGELSEAEEHWLDYELRLEALQEGPG